MQNTNKKTEYAYGFSDEDTSKVSIEKGLTIDTIKKISKLKSEPK
jgi:hypothetical protein